MAIIINPTHKILGKFPAKIDSRNLKLENYLPVKLPKIPKDTDWHNIKPESDWGMDGNDTWGNCVIVTAAHIIDAAKATELKDFNRIPDKDVIALSRQMNALYGYYVLDRLKWWRKKGMWGSQITAFTEVTLKTHKLTKAAIWIFGHCDIGLWMPLAWQNKQVWDTGTGPKYDKGSWGGHSVPLLGFDRDGYFLCTWGEIIYITKAAMDKYCDEQYASIVSEWFAEDNVTPSGFKEKLLYKHLNALDLD